MHSNEDPAQPKKKKKKNYTVIITSECSPSLPEERIMKIRAEINERQ